MAERQRTRVSCDYYGCHAEAWAPARGWSSEDDRDYCRAHTAARAARFICPSDHGHAAKSTCYSAHGCRCDDCTAENTRAVARRTREKLYGRWQSPYVDAAPAREHVQMLREQGLGIRTIAQVAGVGHTALAQLVYGRKRSQGDPRAGEVLQRMSRRNAERILAVVADESTLAPGTSVAARGAQRRIEALVARGWCLSRIAAVLGISPSNLAALLERGFIQLGTKRKLVELYERLWNVAPPRQTRADAVSYTRAIHMAQDRGWLPPMAWDDIDTDEAPPADDAVDDVDALDQGAVDAALDGFKPPLRTAERREVVRILHGRRWSDQRIAGWLGNPDRTVQRDRQVLGLEALPHGEQRWAS